MPEDFVQKKCGGLLWEDINFENDSFWAGRHTVVKNGVYENTEKLGDELVFEDSGKTPHAPRELPMGKFLSNIFKMKYQEYIDKGIKPKPTDFIFYTKAGNPFYEQSLRKMYKSLAKKLGISEIGCYSLRHEHCTFLTQETDADQETIKQLEGWAQIIPTYFHTDDKHKRKAISVVDKQYEDDSEPDIDNSNIVRNGNIIQFPFGNVVNE